MTSCPLVVGLLGGIGSGKSSVARAFARRGADVLDADRIAHAVLDQPGIRRRIVRRWGTVVLGSDGRVDRAALAARVFGSGRQIRALNRLVHPVVRRAFEREIRKARMNRTSRQRLIVLDAPLLMEAGAHRLCDALVYVQAPRAVRLQRVRRRSGWSAAELARRERFQVPAAAKRRAARFVVNNARHPGLIGPQVRSILEALGHDA